MSGRSLGPRLSRARDAGILLCCGAAVVLGARAAPTSSGEAEPVMPSASPSAAPAALPSGAASAVTGPKTSLGTQGCSFEDAGSGDYRLAKVPGGAKLWVRPLVLGPDGGYDLLLHFHGGEPVRRILAPRGGDYFFATLDEGDSSADYAGTIPTRRAWDELIASIDAAASDALGTKAHARRIAVSSFSAGFAAVDEVLAVAGDDVSGVLLLDSLYASYVPDGSRTRPAPVPRFALAARRALDSDRFTFALTYSQIVTPSYASTSEVAAALLEELVVHADRIESPHGGALPLELVARERGFVVRGYGGTDAAAHCAHLGLLPELLDVWRAHR